MKQILLILLAIGACTAHADWKVVEQIGDWSLAIKEDLMTDRRRCRISSVPTKREGGGYLAKTNLLFLEPELDPNKPDNLWFYTSGVLSSSKYITYRFDKKEPVEVRLDGGESTHHEINLAYQSNGPGAYQFRESEKFILKVHIYSEGPMILVFSNRGFGEAYDAAVACQKEGL